ncbi:MAG TPA: DUF3631 domain-containing protein [Allosphingosinicella sp.]
MSGAEILDAVQAFLGRFVAYPSPEAPVAHTLWIAHAHLMDSWESTPRLAFLSPEPGSGKTRALEISALLVPNPVEAVNVTPSYLFRRVGAGGETRPTILFDEIDTVFGPRARENEEIRGMLNAGHRRGASAGRCAGRGRTEEIQAYCAVAVAGLGKLPDTLLARSIVIPMRRRAPGERVEPYRRRLHHTKGHALRALLAEWALSIRPQMNSFMPELPPGIADRDADLWESLIAVADAAGGPWPARARVTAVTAVTASRRDSPSLGIRLLHDLRAIFGEQDQLPTGTILASLHALEESPWGDLRGKPLDAIGLARRLRPYEIRPTTFRELGVTIKGYRRGDMTDAWSRYLAVVS